MSKNYSDIYKIKPGLTIALHSLNGESAHDIILITEVFFWRGNCDIILIFRVHASLIQMTFSFLFQVRMMLITECNLHSAHVAVFDTNDHSGNNKNK